MKIVSVSRRSDIPAFYPDWFLSCLKKGEAVFRHPFSGKECRIDLRPAQVAAFVFWSKNYGGLMAYLPRLLDSGYRFYCHFTITGHPRLLEPGIIPLEEALSQFARLAALLSPLHIQWRFDPIVPSEEASLSHHLAKFERLAIALEAKTRRCYVSFLAPFRVNPSG